MIPESRVHFRIPPRLNLLIARGRRASALKLLDKIIGSDYGLFREDAEILQDRQAALHFKIDLLLEWDRYSEALARLCLETEINPDNVLDQAMKQRLKRQLHIDDLDRGRQHSSWLQEGPAFSNPIRWDDVAGMRELKLTLENDIIMPFLEPEVYKR